jgi:hypothetical protein
MERRSSISSQYSPNRQTHDETASQMHSSTFNPVPGSPLRATRLSKGDMRMYHYVAGTLPNKFRQIFVTISRVSPNIRDKSCQKCVTITNWSSRTDKTAFRFVHDVVLASRRVEPLQPVEQVLSELRAQNCDTYSCDAVHHCPS